MWAAVEPPRLLVIAAGGWFVGALALAVGVRQPASLALASLFPSVRICLLATIAGIFVGWPLLRLSLYPPRRIVATVALDVLTLGLLFQSVLWPMRLATPWPIERTLLIDALTMASLAGAAGMTLLGCYANSGVARGLAMVGALALTTGIAAPLSLGEGMPGIVDAMDATSSIPTRDEWLHVACVEIGNFALLATCAIVAAIMERRAPRMLARSRSVG